MLEYLRAEHHQLNAAVAALRLKIVRARPERWESLLAEADAVAAAIAEHDALESELLADALESP